MSVDFDELKYDLYKILNLSKDCTLSEIKKQYKKNVLLNHPDKNRDADEEFFTHINIAYKILSNPEHRQAYNEWSDWKNEHKELKKQFEKQEKIVYKKTFSQIEKELNNKHKFNTVTVTALTSEETTTKLDQLNNMRKNITVPQYDIKNVNQGFDKIQENPANYHQSIIPYSGEIMEYTPTSSQFASLADIGTLYKEGENLKEKSISSVSVAFSLQQKVDYVESDKSFEERIKEYQSQTKNLQNIVPKPKKNIF